MHFPDNVSHYYAIPEVSTAQFDESLAWSFFAFFRIENSASARRTVVAKYGSAANRHMVFGTNSGTAPVGMRLIMNAGSMDWTSSAVVDLDTWYLVMLANDAGASSNLHMYVARVRDGVVLIDNETNTLSGNHGFSTEIQIGRRSTIQQMAGDIVHLGYYSAYYTKAHLLQYLRNPWNFSAQYKADEEFHIPLNAISSDQYDLSGNANDALEQGTDCTPGGMPQIITPLHFWPSQNYLPAAASSGVLPMAMNSYRQRRAV